MKVSAGSVLSFSALLASAAATPHNLDDIPQWSTREFLENAGFYEGKLDPYLTHMKAAVRRVDLGKRDDGIKVVNQLEMVYASDQNEYGMYGGRKIQQATMNGETKEPVLMIEKFDNHIDSVECSGTTVKMNFNNIQSFMEAKETTKDAHGYTVITSHPGCQEEDERRPFKIESVETDEDAMQVKLMVSKRKFQSMFKKMSMDYGETYEPHVLRTNVRKEIDRIAKRASGPTWTYPGAESASAPIPTGTPSSSSGGTDLHWESKGSFTLPNIITKHLNFALEVGCNYCVQEGHADFTQGRFEFDFDIDWTDFDVSFFKGGWVNLALTDYSAHMDMYAIPSGTVYFWKPLVEIPFPGAGYIIPGFGKLGIFFSPAVLAAVTVASPIQFNYGFNVSLPDSHVKVDFGEMDGEVVGFPEAQIDALPFTANDSQPALTITGAFMPRIPIGFDFGTPDEGGEMPDGGVTCELAIFAATPQISWEFTPGCGGGNGTNSTMSDLAVRDSGDLVQMSPSVEIGAGFDLVAKVRMAGIDPAFFTRVTLVSTAWDLPTACYSVDLAAATWSEVDAQSTAAAAKVIRKEALPPMPPKVTKAPVLPKVAVPVQF